MRVTHISLHTCTTPSRRWKRSEVGLSEAERHLRVARSLLQLRPNAWIEQLVAINSSCIALIECDARRFERHAAEGRRLAATTGHTNSDAVMDTNDAHFALISGNFDKASTLLERILHSPGSIYVELAALEGQARMYLALGRLAECDHVLKRIESVSTRPSSARPTQFVGPQHYV